ncbi:MAG: hypothetical protein F4114_13040 [Rhodospirillaceae bacterium]|nr:hypothetical protein [Rhodospirillaceae bacterium]MYB13949.1 hypothetical protein [Rhodospirillaceae bacterium]MYI49993.1 hypothetical protein [Rhodospirillaceae bacterium]
MTYFHKIILAIIFGIIVAFSTNTVSSQEKMTLDTPGIYATIAKRFLGIIEDCESLKTQQKDLECSIKALWEFADISADDRLSAAEINRFFAFFPLILLMKNTLMTSTNIM